MNALFEIRLCTYCKNEMELKIVQKGKRKGLLDKKVINKKFCSTKCQNLWQQETTWEDRIGIERADEIRLQRSEQVSGDKNPACNPLVAKKISESLSRTLRENPEMRLKENNPFYGKTHTAEYKTKASSSKIGKRSYTDEQLKIQNRNTLKLENHPNWKGGASYEEYDYGFTPIMKESIKSRDNYTCQICSKQPKQLHIHHIDYDKQNSVEENLIALCNSCHSKTNWKRNTWIEYFQPIMKIKYLT